MVDWKLYIDSPQERALKLCHGSLTERDGVGFGYGVPCGDGFGYGNCYGGRYGRGEGGSASADGAGVDYSTSYGNGMSAIQW